MCTIFFFRGRNAAIVLEDQYEEVYICCQYRKWCELKILHLAL